MSTIIPLKPTFFTCTPKHQAATRTKSQDRAHVVVVKVSNPRCVLVYEVVHGPADTYHVDGLLADLHYTAPHT